MFSLRPFDLVLTALFVCLMTDMSHGGNSNWNQETRDYIVEIHNDKRRAEGGCHINKIEYDMDLEKEARRWAEGCVFKHELKGGRGENLAWNSNQLEEKELIKKAADSWFKEKNTYSYGQNSCGNTASCHYTQMVWGTTNKIGCYSTRCGYLTGATQNAWYFVCFYTPKGNWNGEKPYEKGCSSQCLEGQTEDNGLCVGEGKGAGKTGADVDEICDDELGSCQIWSQTGQCQANPSYMNLHCRKSCKVCVSKGECNDLHTSCAEWERSGQCASNASYMNHNCKKSCKKC